MKQFVLPEQYHGEQVLTLKNGTFHHLARVLRLKKQDLLKGIDRNNRIYLFRVTGIERDRCILEKTDTLEHPKKAYHVTLFQCLLKGKKFTQVVRQATEAGVDRIVPIASEYSIPRIDRLEEKTTRLKRVALEAVEQSGTTTIPEILEPLSIQKLPDFWGPGGTAFYCHNEPEGSETLHKLLSIPAERIALCIGPEGGLSEQDRALLESADFRPLYLGPSTLRAETAAVFALGAIHILLMEKETWTQKSR